MEILHPGEILADQARADDMAVLHDQATVSLMANASFSESLLERSDLLELAKIKDSFHLFPCEVNPVSETLLRFIEYDRTDAEKLGDPYTGDGNRDERRVLHAAEDLAAA